MKRKIDSPGFELESLSIFLSVKTVTPTNTDTLHAIKYNYNDYRLIGLVVRVFTNGPGDLGSIPGRFIPMTLEMVLDTSL